MQISKMQIAAVYGAIAVFWYQGSGIGHHLHTASNTQVIHAAHDIGSGQIHRRNARAAKAI